MPELYEPCWRERAIDRYEGTGWFYLAEDDHGDLLVPGVRTAFEEVKTWRTRFHPWKLWHWLPWLRSRVTVRIVMVERVCQ